MADDLSQDGWSENEWGHYRPEHDLGFGQMIVDWEDERPDMKRMRNDRLEKARASVEERDIDALFTFRWENVRYLTGFRRVYWPVITFGAVDAVFAPGMDRAYLYTMDDTHVKERMSWQADHVGHEPAESLESPAGARKFLEKARGDLEEHGVEPDRVAVDSLSHPLMEAFEVVFPDAELLNGQDVIMDARKIKTEDEIKCLKIACQLTSRGMAKAQDLIHNKVGIRENEVLSAAFKEMYDMGSEWTQCSNIVTSGPSTHPYRRVTSDRMISPGEFVIVDIGGCYNGYFADFTRTFVAGDVDPSDEQREVFQRSYEALQIAVDALRPGRTTYDVYKEVDEAGGVHGEFLGHGDGMGAAEAPWLAAYSEDDPEEIEEGMVFSLEPFAGEEGVGGVRLEHNVVVRSDGTEIISRYPFESRLLE